MPTKPESHHVVPNADGGWDVIKQTGVRGGPSKRIESSKFFLKISP
jgi:hypothetical protein